MTTLRTATKEDFKKGTVLIAKDGGWFYKLIKKYDDGIWECKSRVHFENEARHYNVKI